MSLSTSQKTLIHQRNNSSNGRINASLPQSSAMDESAPLSPTIFAQSPIGSDVTFNESVLDRIDTSSIITQDSASKRAFEHAIMRNRDLIRHSETLGRLLRAACHYHQALLGMQKAACDFASIFEECARAKTVDEHQEDFQAIGALLHVVSNHNGILAGVVSSDFEKELFAKMNLFKDTATKNEALYRRELAQKTQELRTMASKHVERSRHEERDLFSFKESLEEQVILAQEIENLQVIHEQESLLLTETNWKEILAISSRITRAIIDIHKAVAKKGEDGEGLDLVLKEAPDPFRIPNQLGTLSNANLVPSNNDLANEASRNENVISSSKKENQLEDKGQEERKELDRSVELSH